VAECRAARHRRAAGVRRRLRGRRRENFLRAGLSHRHDLAGRGRHQEGFFAANGVEMDTVSIGVSPGMQAVASGSLNIMHNTCNAVISFIEMGGGGVHLSLVSMGIHPGVVVGQKGLKSAAELKGKMVGTSSIKSGSTILLRRLLKARGLEPSAYDVRRGAGQRADLQRTAGRRARCGLAGAAAVAHRHDRGLSRDRHLQGGGRRNSRSCCFATNDAWVKSNTAAAQGFAKAWLAGVAWLYDPRNPRGGREAAADELKLTPEIAAATYDALIVKSADTYPRDGRVDLDVLRAMIDIMVEGEELPARPQGDIGRYLDDTMLGGGK